MDYRILLSVILAFSTLLFAACVSRSTPTKDANAERFLAQWQAAEPLDVCFDRLDELVLPGISPGLDRSSTVLLTAAFWPDQTHKFPGLPGLIEREGSPEREVPECLSASMVVVDGRAAHELLSPVSCRWLVYAGLEEAWAPVSDGATLDVGDVAGARELRVVFAIAVEPRILQGVRHGTALDVAAWGMGLEVHSAQLLDESGKPLRYWFHRS